MNNPQIDLTRTLGATRKSVFRRAIGWILGLGLTLGAAGAIWFFFFRADEAVISYITAEAKKQDLTVTVQATGNLEPVHTVTVGIEVSGTLAEVLVDYNDPVEKGQVLARLDTAKLESALRSSRGSLKVAEANVRQQQVALDEAKRQRDRLEQIFKTTEGAYPSQKEMETVRSTHNKTAAALSAAEAQLEQAKAGVSTDEENLKKAVVVSPINGIVLTRAVDPGQTVAASMQAPTLFTLAEDLSRMQVVVGVDEADVGDVKAGQPVTFTVNAYPEKTFKGTVSQVRLGSQIVSGVVTYSTVVQVDNDEGLLRPGMTAQASIITRLTENALVVPNAAFRFKPPSEQKSSASFMRMPGGIRPPSSKAQNGDRLWVLKEGVPVQIKVKKGDSDGLVTAVESPEMIPGAPVITGVRQL